MTISRWAVLEFFAQERRSVDVAALMRRFRLSDKAAVLHLARLARYGLIAPTTSLGPFNRRRFTITPRGLKRLEWHELGDKPARAGGMIEFR